MCRMYKILLEIEGFTVLGWANNGDEALKMLNSEEINPDVILMDHRMPVRNGFDTALNLLKNNKNLKIIFISADNSIKDKALKLGALHFIEKPFHNQDLIKIINNIIMA